jgi:hypothetical protein
MDELIDKTVIKKSSPYPIKDFEKACRSCGQIYVKFDYRSEIKKLDDKSQENPFCKKVCLKCLKKFDEFWIC